MSISIAEQLRGRIAPALLAARPRPQGRVGHVVGLGIGVQGVTAAVGELLTVHTAAGPLPAQVVAVQRESVTCMPLGATVGVSAGDPVTPSGDVLRIPAGPGLLGRVIDPLGRPMDGRPPATAGIELVPADASAPNPLQRRRVETALPTGVRAIDTLIPVGAGQRVGIMAGSGVGKSTLLGMAVRGTSAPVRVVALVGERGREVREFIEDTLDEAARSRTVMVVATADDPALLRVTAAFTATRIAEFFRDQGNDVLLVVDSVTRTAMAQREVALAAGEAPATRGYPASVFAMLPRLLERSGPGRAGSITAMYTVLVEGDDLNDPVGDTVRGILDGHIVLARALATAGHFPSIDVLESVSRVERAVLGEQQRQIAAATRQLLAAWREVRELVEVGAYAAGSDPIADLAIRLRPQLDAFLKQAPDEVVPYDQSWSALADVLSPPAPAPRREFPMSGFRLATVERLRGTRVQDCARMLGEATMALEQALARKAFVVEQLAATAAQRFDSAQQLMTAGWFRERLRAELITIEGEIDRLSVALEAARGHWLQARAELKAVETLHHRHRATVRAQQLMKEQRELDDLAGAGVARSLAGVGGDAE